MAKTRVKSMVREAVSTKSNNQNADLQAMTQKYGVFCKNIHVLGDSLKLHLGALQQIVKTRAAVSQSVSTFTKNTPLWESTGQMPGSDNPAGTVCSFASVNDNLISKQTGYVEKFEQHVLKYALEWEKTVVTRVNNGLKKVDESRRELNHYEKKVESLRLATNKVMASGKSVKAEQAEKLKRNEEKLLAAKQGYNKLTRALCILMDEVTDRYWRDLHPLLIKILQFDMTMSSDESKILSEFNKIVTKLKHVADTNGLPAQDRLKDLGSLNPELLSTRPGGVGDFAAIEEQSNPAISHSGAMGGGGVFGTGGNLSRDSSFGSFASNDQPSFGGAPVNNDAFNPTSTLGMLSIQQQSAPPPTMNDLYGMSQFSSAPPPSSGGYPMPMPPMQPQEQRYRTSSYGSASSAPPPAAPPPPPPGGYSNLVVPAPSSGSPYSFEAPAPSPWGQPPMSAPPSQYGYPQQSNFAAPAPAYGAPHSYGAPSPYGAPPAYGAPAPPMSYGAPSPYNTYGAPAPAPQNTNPFDF